MEILVGAAVDSSLDLSVRTCVRSSPPGVATRERRTHTTCGNVRPWLRQGLGCSRADPRGILSLSACSLTRCVFARAEEDFSPPLQTPCGSRARLATSPSAWSWFPPCHVWSTFVRRWERLEGLYANGVLHLSLGFASRDRALVCSGSSCYRFGLRVALPPKLSRV